MLDKISDVSLLNCLDFSLFLFVFGFAGCALNKRNLFICLICLEISFIAVSVQFIFFALFMGTSAGFGYALTVIALTALESAIGFTLIVVSYRSSSKVSFSQLTCLKG